MPKNNNRTALYKKFLRLKVNPLSNNKFFKFKLENIIIKKNVGKTRKPVKVEAKRFVPVAKFKKEKWSMFLNFLEKKLFTKRNRNRVNFYYKKLKPYTVYSYNASKFASQGNSFKKKFRNDLFAKKTFNYMYGGLVKKYLKKRMTEIYTHKKPKNSIKLCMEFFESRLDSVLCRSKFADSLGNAKQLILHKHIKVNNKIEKSRSYILKQGDLITLNSKSTSIVKNNLKKQFQERPDSIMWPIPPSYLNINYNTLEIIFGDIENFNFATSFAFKIDTNSVVTNYYRH